ncbi:hypothetical protein KR222_008312, partial [Zaprionus bogoriensis]
AQMRYNQFVLSSVVLLLLLPRSSVLAAKILIVFPYDLISQCFFLKPYLEALVAKGHQLTLIHAFPKCASFEQIHTIYVKDRYDVATGEILKKNKIKVCFNTSSLWGQMISIRSYLVKVALNILENKNVQKLMQSNVTFDLVIMEPAYMNALYGCAAHFNASLIGIATSGSYWNLDTLVGHTTTFETMGHTGLWFGISQLDRFYNWMIISEEWLIVKVILQPAYQEVHERFFGHLPQRYFELQQSFSLILLNQHFSMFAARPNVPGMVEIGGMHLPKQTPQLPPELMKFVNEAPDGVIVMALGLELQSKDLPKATLKLMLETFEALPQRVIWKFESDPPFNVSSSIYMIKWLPQQALLAHPNVRLFINHGGMLSVIEAAHYGKPVLGLPAFFDQFRNVGYLIKHGVAEQLNCNKLTRQNFEMTIRRLMDRSSPYTQNALALSVRFRDQLVHPLDTAVYWTEYVMRYKGAPHMRVSSSNLKLLDYYDVDNLFMVLGRFALIVSVVYYVLLKLKRSIEQSYW